MTPSRLLLALLLCWGFLVPSGSAQTVTGSMSFPTGGAGAMPGSHFYRIHNPTGAATTVRMNNGPNGFGAASPRMSWGASGADVVVPAGGYVDYPVSLSTTQGSAGVGSYTYTISGLTSVSFVKMPGFISMGWTPVNYSWNVGINVLSSGSKSVSGNFQVGHLYISNPAASGKITVTADALAAGNRFKRMVSSGGTPFTPEAVVLTVGSNLVVNTTTPTSYVAGDTFQILQMIGSTPNVIGSVVITKDSFGNFDLSLNATGLPVGGTVQVLGQIGLVGNGRIVTAGHEGLPYAFSFNATNSQVAQQTWADASMVANGALVVVEYREGSTGDWQEVGAGAISKAPDGSFSLTISVSGEEDAPPPPADTAVFRLELVSFETSAKTVQLEIDGQVFTPTGAGVGGDAVNGLQKTLEVLLPGNPQDWMGKPYKWIVSGTMGGLAVNGMMIAEGTSPNTGDNADSAHPGFVVVSSATIGDPTLDPGTTPANAFDPENPPPDPESPEGEKHAEQKTMYEAMRKAFEDAMGKSAGHKAPDGPSGEEGKGVAAAVGKAGAAFDGAVKGAAGQVAGPGSGGWSGTSSVYMLNLPVFGPTALDLSTMDPWPGLIRALLLAWCAWMASVAGMRIFRGAFSG